MITKLGDGCRSLHVSFGRNDCRCLLVLLGTSILDIKIAPMHYLSSKQALDKLLTSGILGNHAVSFVKPSDMKGKKFKGRKYEKVNS
jgi:hypothetical protein